MKGIYTRTHNSRWKELQETPQAMPATILQKKLVSFASLSAVSGTFNSLFKVLFTFPSRYFFAIGLESIFSFRRRSPPNLRTNSKVRDSSKTRRTIVHPTRRGSHPLRRFLPKRLALAHYLAMLLKTTIQCKHGFTVWAYPGSFAITKGIIFIFFSSAYLYA